MSRTGVMTRLAVRELWISLRLFGIVTVFVAAGALVAFLPAPLPRTMLTFAGILALATVLSAAVAAWSMAEERRAGRAGWLVTRSLSRGALLAGWFVGIAVPALAALAAAGALGWLAASAVTLRLEPAGYASLVGAVAASVLAAIALGLAAGTVLAPLPAAVASAAVVAAAILAAWLLRVDPTLVPGGALAALAALAEPGAAVGPGLRAAGVSLAAAAVLLIVARVLLDRAEL